MTGRYWGPIPHGTFSGYNQGHDTRAQMLIEPADPDELYRYNERLAICLENGVPYERAVEIAREEIERQGNLLRP